MRTDFLNAALAEVKLPEILVNMVSKRVRQLGLGYRPLVAVDPRWTFMEVALKEIADKKLTYELVAQAEEAKVRQPRGKRRKSEA